MECTKSFFHEGEIEREREQERESVCVCVYTEKLSLLSLCLFQCELHITTLSTNQHISLRLRENRCRAHSQRPYLMAAPRQTSETTHLLRAPSPDDGTGPQALGCARSRSLSHDEFKTAATGERRTSLGGTANKKKSGFYKNTHYLSESAFQVLAEGIAEQRELRPGSFSKRAHSTMDRADSSAIETQVRVEGSLQACLQLSIISLLSC
jgi:hypothetical protein